MLKRPHDVIPVPPPLAPLIGAIRARMKPSEVWLFGSRARGDARENSDWDLVVGLPDEADDGLLDPRTAWEIQRVSGVRATILTARTRDLIDVWGLPNTVGFDLAEHGKRLDV